MLSSMADKHEVNNKLSKLNIVVTSIIKQLETLTNKDSEGTAMLAKKSWQCISCEKNLVNY